MPYKLISSTKAIHVKSLNKPSGFTLIELVIGIVVLSLSFTIIFSMIAPSATQSAQQIQQIRASELGKSLLNEIMSKAFDENSNMANGTIRCGEDIDGDGKMDTAGEINCTLEGNLGNEEGGNRVLFDDVDDFNGLTSIQNSLGGDLNNLYNGFSVLVEVCNDSDYNGVCGEGDNKTAKFIKVTLTSATSDAVVFSSYRANF